MKSINQAHFASIPGATIERSKFNRSSGTKTTFDAGWLIPVWVDEALPGDTFSLKMATFARLATPIKPVMDNLYLESFFFAVPNRLLWENWEKFNGAQTNPGDSTDFLIPQIFEDDAAGVTEGSLGDYFGLPVGVAPISVSAFWHRAYALIYNEWFRDENLQNATTVSVSDGPDAMTAFPLLRRGKRKDYFTSSLPFPQKGAAVQLPLGTSAPVIPDPLDIAPVFSVGQSPSTTLRSSSSDLDVHWQGTPNANASAKWVTTGLTADLTNATAATINELREAFQVQRLFERDARGGTRYTEILRAHFGISSPDQRLQRPEYLGGGSQPITFSAVPQTSETNTTEQGNMAAYAVSASSGHGFRKSFTEHCTLIGLVSVRADLTYSQGINRMWSRETRFDFYWPALSHLGEQEILGKEIYFEDSDNPDNESIFGYQERYAEYRYKPSMITGKFRSSDPQSLDIWHLSQDFATRPLLNATFIEENPPIARIVATPTEPAFLFDAFFTLHCARPMPTYGVPGMIDHF